MFYAYMEEFKTKPKQMKGVLRITYGHQKKERMKVKDKDGQDRTGQSRAGQER